MTPEDLKERMILSLMNERGKFGLEVGYVDPEDPHAFQDALERLMMRDWIRLIDISPVADSPYRLFRIFVAMPVAVEWFRRNS